MASGIELERFRGQLIIGTPVAMRNREFRGMRMVPAIVGASTFAGTTPFECVVDSNGFQLEGGSTMLPVLSRGTMNWPDTSDWLDREFGRMMRRFWGENGGSTMPTVAYPVNMWEDNDAVYVEAELPGFKRDEVEITLEQGMLSITAERKHEQNAGTEAGRLLNERSFRRYHRSFNLPTTVDDAKIEAHLEDGVLHLTLPKHAEVKPRKIAIK
jgi:HSP20 family protein